MITTSKYEENGFADIITGLVKIYNPKIAVELGTQQGASAIIIGKALRDGHLYTFDSFEEKYVDPPFGETHADLRETLKNIKAAGLEKKVTIMPFDAFKVAEKIVEANLLHIDLCNHYGNILVLLEQWHLRVTDVIILEGGGLNSWQKTYGFLPFYPILGKDFILKNYSTLILHKDKNYALTILIRKD